MRFLSLKETAKGMAQNTVGFLGIRKVKIVLTFLDI